MTPTSGKYALCMINRAGWKSIRLRFERFLPPILGGEWCFVHLEEHGQFLGSLTRRLGKFQMLHDVWSGRSAAQAALRSGATKILFGTYHNCPWLPEKKGVRYFIIGDATIAQLARLGYSRQGREASRMTKLIYGRGLRRLARAGHHFFSMSQWYSDALIQEHGVPPAQITFLPPFVDTDYWQPRVGERSPGPLRVVFIGADFLRKGGDVLMEVVAQPEFAAVQWHLVTKSPPANPPSNVTCHTGFNSDAEGLRNLVQNSDVLVLPTRADSSSIVALEAGACGVPSIITRMAGITDLVEDGRTGFFLDQPVADQLAAALRKYVAAPELLTLHGRAAREKVVREFDVRVILERIRQTIARVD